MKAKEKAESLVKEFSSEIGSYTNDLVLSIAIRCAKKCIEEIMHVFEKYDEDNNRLEECRPLKEYDYWLHVKKEIENYEKVSNTIY